jgi:serine/threonine protein kinase
MAPEILRNEFHYTDRCDVYSFGIIMYELMFEIQPYSKINQAENVNGHFNNLFNLGFEVLNGKRPEIPELQFLEGEQLYTDLMQKCWDSIAELRPSFLGIHNQLKLIHDIYSIR